MARARPRTGAGDALLELIGDVVGLLDLDDFRTGLLAAVRRAVPADWISLNDLGEDPQSAVFLVEPGLPEEAIGVFARLAHENPLIRRHERTHDGRAYRFSDVVSREELHGLALYREFYAPLGVEHQMAFTLPAEPGRLLGVALSRRRRDFADDERALLDRARPFLVQAYRNAIEHSALRAALAAAASPQRSLARALAAHGLTHREAEAVGWVALGRSDEGVAGEMAIGRRTVAKHLERAYRKLGVRTRSDAARAAWGLVDGRSGPAAAASGEGGIRTLERG